MLKLIVGYDGPQFFVLRYVEGDADVEPFFARIGPEWNTKHDAEVFKVELELAHEMSQLELAHGVEFGTVDRDNELTLGYRGLLKTRSDDVSDHTAYAATTLAFLAATAANVKIPAEKLGFIEEALAAGYPEE